MKKDNVFSAAGSTFLNGVIKENPTFVLMLGMCPTLAVTSSAINGLGMGLSTLVVLTLSNVIISLLRNVIPDKVRIPAFIVIIASFVTIVGQLMEAYFPELNESLGAFIQLIVVNCIILGRAEAFASKNRVLLSAADGIGMGLGFTGALTIIGMIREFLGKGMIFGYLLPVPFTPIKIFAFPPGAFFVLAFIVAVMNAARLNKLEKGEKTKLLSGCSVDHDCANCSNDGCSHKFYDVDGADTSVGKKGGDNE